MPTPLEICLEELDAADPEAPFIRCVALPGGEPGLALDRDGTVRWMPQDPADYGLWVSSDERLVLLRGEGAGPITVSRAGRWLEAPAGKPVLLLDQDLLVIQGRRLRVHVHGPAQVLHEPERLSRSALARLVKAAAAALALGTAAGASAEPARGNAEPIQVRARPPAPVATRPVYCEVTAMPAPKKGPALVHARCPAGSGLYVGARGQLLDAEGKPVPEGTVVVKEIKEDKMVGETQLKKRVKATRVLFHIR